jgi:hypothetical protein
MTATEHDDDTRVYTVTFVADYAVVTTTINATDEEEAEIMAAALLDEYYKLDTTRWSCEVEEGEE